MIAAMMGLAVTAAAVLLVLPWRRKPLSEDEGNWFYLAAFEDRGIRLYEDCHAHGYFNLSWFAALAARLFDRHDPRFFQDFKIAWNAATVLSCFGLSLALGAGTMAAASAAAAYALVTATPRAMFMLTYAEHFFILPMCLAIMSALAGTHAASWPAFAAAGVCAALVVQFKPTGVLFAAGLGVALMLCDDPLRALVPYAAGFAGLSLLPIALLRRYDFQNEHVRAYLASTFLAPAVNGLRALSLLTGNSARYATLGRSPYADDYTTRHHADTGSRLDKLRANLFPCLRDLRVVLVLAVWGMVAHAADGNAAGALVPLALLGAALAAQHLQQNYYTPHFNPGWLPMALLAGEGTARAASVVLDGDFAGVLLGAMLAYEAVRLARIVARGFGPGAEHDFGILHGIVGELFSLAATAGRTIRETSAPSERLLVWGNQPSVHLYARRQAADSRLLFLYAQDDHLARPDEALDSIRTNPPDLLLFFFWRARTQWNAERVMEATGVPFRAVTAFSLDGEDGAPLTGHHGAQYMFPLYRLDRDRFALILRERAAVALLRGNPWCAERTLNQLLTLDETDDEAALLLETATRHGAHMHSLRRDAAPLASSDAPLRQAAGHRLLGLSALALNQADVAIRSLERSLATDPDSALALALHGEALRLGGDTARALRAFRDALRANCFSALAHAGTGACLMAAGQHEAARAHIERARAYAPAGAQPPALEHLP